VYKGENLRFENNESPLVLDGLNQANARWIFQCSGSLNLDGIMTIINLPGYVEGQSSAPVFWAVKDDGLVTIISSMLGNVLTAKSITFHSSDVQLTTGALLTLARFSVWKTNSVIARASIYPFTATPSLTSPPTAVPTAMPFATIGEYFVSPYYLVF
jgi:hypothetical protein